MIEAHAKPPPVRGEVLEAEGFYRGSIVEPYALAGAGVWRISAYTDAADAVVVWNSETNKTREIPMIRLEWYRHLRRWVERPTALVMPL
jgi:hypothetical protein